MENKRSLFVLLACALFASVLAVSKDTPAPVTEVPSSSSTSAGTTITPKPTNPPSTTSTDPAPTTTTTTTTTLAPTTPAPTPTTPAPAPTTPAPTPSPFPDSLQKGNWTVSGDNVTCILAVMAVSAKIKYPVQGNTTLEKTVFVPSLAKAEGSCDSANQWIKLTWGNNSMQVEFKKNDTAKMYFISQITYSLFTDSDVFKNISTELANQQFNFMRVKQDYMVNLNQSFHCTREQNLTLSNDGSKINAELFLSSVQLQAFHTENKAVFGTPQYCELDTPDIVPIAVGCALAALVIVVLVAYLVGRRRSQARGYLSM